MDNESIVVHLENELYYSLNGTATVVWRKMAEGASLEECADHLHAAHPEVAREVILKDVENVFQQLLERKLLVPVP